MNTHRRAWFVRAGVGITAAAACLFAVASPAAAADPQVQITEVSGNVKAGQAIAMKFRVQNGAIDGPNTDEPINVAVAADNGALSCSGPKCNFTETFKANEQKSYQVDLVGGSLAPGESRQVKITITASGEGDPASAERTITVQGPQQVQTVPEVSGIVVDVFTAKPIEAAEVYLQDSASPPHTYSVGTGKDGKFKFTSKQDAPIVAGIIVLRVEKDGLQPASKTVNTSAGVAVRDQRLAATPNSSPTPSASAGPSSVSPSTDVSPIVDDTSAGGLSEGGGGLSWILIAIGGVLVLLGIGAIVLLFVRKRDDDDSDDSGPRRGGGPRPRTPPGRGGPRPPQSRRGGPPDRTTVMRGPGGPGHDPRARPPVSPGPRGADQTMIARSPLADVPTQLHNRVPADYADPNRQGGAQPGYGPSTYGATGGYPQQPPYPGGAPGGYQPGPAGYGQPDPYAPPPPNAYGGYEGQPGYGQPDPYAQPDHTQPGGQPPYGHDPRAPRPGQPPQGDGRRVDWLDD